MTLRGSCKCHNIDVVWRTADYSLVPRVCPCDYCRAMNAAYVSKSGTRVEIAIRKGNLLQIHRHGTMSAMFHTCAHCAQLVFVTAEIAGDQYCALNARCINNPVGFSAPVKLPLPEPSAAARKQVWRQNWCHPVRITG